MSRIIIEDTFRPEIYANSMTVPKLVGYKETGLPTWAKVIMAVVALGMLMIMAAPHIDKWLSSFNSANSDQEVKP